MIGPLAAQGPGTGTGTSGSLCHPEPEIGLGTPPFLSDKQVDYGRGPPSKTYSVAVRCTMQRPDAPATAAGRPAASLLTNEFNFVFYCDDVSRTPLVYPRTCECPGQWILRSAAGRSIEFAAQFPFAQAPNYRFPLLCRCRRNGLHSRTPATRSKRRSRRRTEGSGGRRLAIPPYTLIDL